MKAWVIMAAGLLALAPSAGAALAQGAGGPVATARPDTPPPPPTPEQAEAARNMALARQVYALVAGPSLDGDVRVLSTTLEVQVAQSMAAKDRVRARAIVDAVNESIDDIKPQIADSAVRAMAADFTPQQLRDMLAFYQSSSGQAALHKLPIITRQSLSTTLSVLPDLMASVETDFCAKVRCSSQDHQAFAAAAARLAAARPAPRTPKAPNTPSDGLKPLKPLKPTP